MSNASQSRTQATAGTKSAASKRPKRSVGATDKPVPGQPPLPQPPPPQPPPPKPEAPPTTRLGSGEDPSVESGVDKNDPEQAAATGAIDKSFE